MLRVREVYSWVESVELVFMLTELRGLERIFEAIQLDRQKEKDLWHGIMYMHEFRHPTISRSSAFPKSLT